MRVGVPRELKTDEARVAITPLGVRELTSHGHAITVERGAGSGSGFADEDYGRAGAGGIPPAR
jgi:alanine dehydrogenase